MRGDRAVGVTVPLGMRWELVCTSLPALPDTDCGSAICCNSVPDVDDGVQMGVGGVRLGSCCRGLGTGRGGGDAGGATCGRGERCPPDRGDWVLLLDAACTETRGGDEGRTGNVSVSIDFGERGGEGDDAIRGSVVSGGSTVGLWCAPGASCCSTSASESSRGVLVAGTCARTKNSDLRSSYNDALMSSARESSALLADSSAAAAAAALEKRHWAAGNELSARRATFRGMLRRAKIANNTCVVPKGREKRMLNILHFPFSVPATFTYLTERGFLW